MDNKAKILFAVFLFSILVLGFFSYTKYFIKKDYLVFAEVPCDPEEEICFVYHCDPEEEECAGIPEEDTSYYKQLEKKAAAIPYCDPNGENCEIAVCDAKDYRLHRNVM